MLMKIEYSITIVFLNTCMSHCFQTEYLQQSQSLGGYSLSWKLCVEDYFKTVKAVFQKCLYVIILNFLDHYYPTVLPSYSILFKTNYFSNYFDSIIRMWVMMYCCRRCHYWKSLLILLFIV